MKLKERSPASPQPILLKQKGDSQVIRLKSKVPEQSMLINLNWQTQADLDLGCFYELKPKENKGLFGALLSGGSDRRSVIDGLQFSGGRGGPRDWPSAQGCYSDEPWIWHTGDDRSGNVAAGESILVNPKGWSALKRMTIYAFIYEGAAQWSRTDAVVTVKIPGNGDVVVPMGQQRSDKTFAAIAGIEFHEEAIQVTKLVTFHNGHAECDRAYRWEMKWQAGAK